MTNELFLLTLATGSQEFFLDEEEVMERIETIEDKYSHIPDSEVGLQLFRITGVEEVDLDDDETE